MRGSLHCYAIWATSTWTGRNPGLALKLLVTPFRERSWESGEDVDVDVKQTPVISYEMFLDRSSLSQNPATNDSTNFINVQTGDQPKCTSHWLTGRTLMSIPIIHTHTHTHTTYVHIRTHAYTHTAQLRTRNTCTRAQHTRIVTRTHTRA